MHHPFDRIPSAALKQAIGIGAVATVGLGLVLLFVVESGPGFGSLAWLLWVAMVLDVPENGAYFLMVLGSVAQPWPAMTVLAVYPRIFVFIASSLYITVGSTRWTRSA